jgi:hypothetical protein
MEEAEYGYFERHAEVNWQGGLMDGKGDAKAGPARSRCR